MDLLTKLALKYEADKYSVGSHTYTPIYSRYLESRRFEDIRILEIGYGGYNNPDAGGASIRMWSEYFPNGEVIAIDINQKNIRDNGYKFLQGDQTDDDFMLSLGEFDFIVDDGSHFSEHVIHTFSTMFHRIKSKGFYIIEDVQTSYWDNFNAPWTLRTMDFFKKIADGLNHAEFPNYHYTPTYTDLNIFSIHFYHNIIIIEKGDNSEPSNLIRHEWETNK